LPKRRYSGDRTATAWRWHSPQRPGPWAGTLREWYLRADSVLMWSNGGTDRAMENSNEGRNHSDKDATPLGVRSRNCAEGGPARRPCMIRYVKSLCDVEIFLVKRLDRDLMEMCFLCSLGYDDGVLSLYCQRSGCRIVIGHRVLTLSAL
jgi:hypothetical protein